MPLQDQIVTVDYSTRQPLIGSLTTDATARDTSVSDDVPLVKAATPTLVNALFTHSTRIYYMGTPDTSTSSSSSGESSQPRKFHFQLLFRELTLR